MPEDTLSRQQTWSLPAATNSRHVTVQLFIVTVSDHGSRVLVSRTGHLE
jgi:hypothetical protein